MTPFPRIISRASACSASRHVIAFVVFTLVWANAGASTPPPNDALDAANAALAVAATADGNHYAADELAAAHRHLDAAQAAMAKHDYKAARALAEEALADADLARAKTHAQAATAQIQIRARDNAELQHRLLDQEPLQQEQLQLQQNQLQQEPVQ